MNFSLEFIYRIEKVYQKVFFLILLSKFHFFSSPFAIYKFYGEEKIVKLKNQIMMMFFLAVAAVLTKFKVEKSINQAKQTEKNDPDSK